MVQIGHTVPKESMFIDHQYVSGTTRSLRDHFGRVADRIVERVAFGPSDYVLDVGGNDGTFLLQLMRHDVRGLNVESGLHQAHLAEMAGVPTINTFFNRDSAREVTKTYGPAKVIHGSGIFFHLEELHSAFAGISDLLADDGFVVAEFIYLPDMIDLCAFDQIYHEHLTYYSLTSFGNLLARHGLKIVDAERMAIHGGSCMAWITHVDSPVPESESLRDMLAEEAALQLDKPDIYFDFAARSNTLREELVALVRSLRAEGKRIHALGAPVKGSTILNYCGFTEQDLECAVEINRLKVGTWIPGTHIPVWHQDEIPPPDIYLMLSWNFKDEILARLSDFRAKGGKIIIPIPQVSVV